MKVFSLITALMLLPTVALAEEHKTLGMQMDVGVPDGAAVGLVVSPKFDWLHAGLSATFNGLGFGVRASATLDPIKYWISPSLTVEGGWSSQGRVPGLDNSPLVGYDYLNVHAGLEFGSRNRFRFFIHAGPSFINMNATGVGPFLTQDKSITVSDPSVTMVLFPTVKLGITAFIW